MTTTRDVPARPRATGARGASLRRGVGRWVVLVAVLWFLATFLIAPNLYSFVTVLNPQKGTFLSLVTELVAVPRVQRAVVNSLVIAVLSVITVNIVGIAQALILEAVKVRGRTILTIAYAIPLVFGSVSAVTGYSMVYGSNGISPMVCVQCSRRCPRTGSRAWQPSGSSTRSR